jgi:succinate dehydrogenase/fumarate reductase cytochrome b subunit
MEGGILGIIVLVADIWAVLNIVQSKAETGPKVLWIAAVVLLPVLGFIAWFMAGPRNR